MKVPLKKVQGTVEINMFSFVGENVCFRKEPTLVKSSDEVKLKVLRMCTLGKAFTITH